MAEPNLHINYSLSDIERYLSGKLSAGEMHDIEKAALQDPFLADAIEGFTSAPLQIAAKHLNQIAASLQQTQERDKAVIAPISRNTTQWLKIAAMVIIVAGAGALAWKALQPTYSFDSGTSKELAGNTPSVKGDIPTPPKPSIVPVQGDTLKPDPVTEKRVPVAFPKEKTEQSVLAYRPQTKRIAAKSDTSFFTEKQAEVVALAGNVQKAEVSSTFADTRSDGAYKKAAPAPAMSKDVAAASTGLAASYQIHGTITDSKGSPLSGVAVKALNGHALSITDEKGKFSLKALDSTGKVEVSTMGYETAVAKVASSQSNVIKLDEEESESLSDMVVTELHSRKKATVTADKNNLLTDTSAYPAGGWQTFQEYVYAKLHKEMDSTGGNQKFTGGEIELEFAIDSQGNPHNLRVVKSFDESLNGKAISAVENGPKWITNDKKKKGRVIVRF